VLLVVLAAAVSTASAADGTKPPRPSVLWQQYPLGTKRLTGPTTTTRTGAPAGAARVTPTVLPAAPASSGSSLLPIVLAAFGTGAAVLALAGLAALYSRSRRVVHTEAALAGALASITLAATGLEGRRRARGLEERLPVWDTFKSMLSPGGITTDPRHEGVEGGVVPPDGQSRTGVDDRVAEIITAAEELADQIRSDAHDEAVQIKRQARVVARRRMRELTRQQETLQPLRAAADPTILPIEPQAPEHGELGEEEARVVESGLRRWQAALSEISRELNVLLEPGPGRIETLLDALEVDEHADAQNAAEQAARREPSRLAERRDRPDQRG
jgi:hypothetical protein